MNFTKSDLFKIRINLFVNNCIPALNKIGFHRSPFASSWFGKNNLGDMSYEFCRLVENSILQVLTVQIAKDDRWIKLYLNIFKLEPEVSNINQLNGIDAISITLPPFSKTKLRIGIDDIKGFPLFSFRYLFQRHFLNEFSTISGQRKQEKRLIEILINDIETLDNCVRRWHELHKMHVFNWKGE